MLGEIAARVADVVGQQHRVASLEQGPCSPTVKAERPLGARITMFGPFQRGQARFQREGGRGAVQAVVAALSTQRRRANQRRNQRRPWTPCARPPQETRSRLAPVAVVDERGWLLVGGLMLRAAHRSGRALRSPRCARERNWPAQLRRGLGGHASRRTVPSIPARRHTNGPRHPCGRALGHESTSTCRVCLTRDLSATAMKRERRSSHLIRQGAGQLVGPSAPSRAVGKAAGAVDLRLAHEVQQVLELGLGLAWGSRR